MNVLGNWKGHSQFRVANTSMQLRVDKLDDALCLDCRVPELSLRHHPRVLTNLKSIGSNKVEKCGAEHAFLGERCT